MFCLKDSRLGLSAKEIKKKNSIRYKSLLDSCDNLRDDLKVTGVIVKVSLSVQCIICKNIDFVGHSINMYQVKFQVHIVKKQVCDKKNLCCKAESFYTECILHQLVQVIK